MYVLFLALFGAICWGLAPAFGKLGLKGVVPLDGLAARTLVTVFFVWGGLFLHSGTGSLERIKAIPLTGWLFLALEAFLATFAGDLAYYSAIKIGDTGKIALILASSPLFTVIFGRYFLNENITPVKIIGGILIVLGVVLVGFNGE